MHTLHLLYLFGEKYSTFQNVLRMSSKWGFTLFYGILDNNIKTNFLSLKILYYKKQEITPELIAISFPNVAQWSILLVCIPQHLTNYSLNCLPIDFHSKILIAD